MIWYGNMMDAVLFSCQSDMTSHLPRLNVSKLFKFFNQVLTIDIAWDFFHTEKTSSLTKCKRTIFGISDSK